jgi:hypothetical protein
MGTKPQGMEARLITHILSAAFGKEEMVICLSVIRDEYS